MVDNWKDIYTDVINSARIDNPLFVSTYGIAVNADGSRNNPLSKSEITDTKHYVLGNGDFSLPKKLNTVGSYPYTVQGTGMRSTRLQVPSNLMTNLKNLTVVDEDQPITLGVHNPSGSVIRMLDIILDRQITSSSAQLNITNCLILKKINSIATYGSNNTFVGLEFTTLGYLGPLANNSNNLLNVYHNCKINLPNTISFYQNNAFSNCTFLIGNETEYKPLVGTNSKELLTDYISRCTTQGISTTGIETRFVFSDNSLDDLYRVKKNSEIDLFGSKYGVYFGYEQPSDKCILIQETEVPQSFNNTQGVSKGMVVEDNTLTLNDTADVLAGATKQSNLFVFDKIKSISALNLSSNLPDTTYASTVKALTKIDITEDIKQGVNYVVASNNGGVATVEYNDESYSSDKSTNNNIFRGVDRENKMANYSTNVILYMVNNYVGIPSVGIRATKKPLKLNVASNLLRKGYWYLVAEGNIEYKGITYTTNSSFLADATTTFTNLGDAKVDEIFIDDENLNPFVDVFINKPTAAMANFSTIAKDSKGILIGSSHPLYSEYINKGYIEGSIQGRIVQLKVGITSKID